MDHKGPPPDACEELARLADAVEAMDMAPAAPVVHVAAPVVNLTSPAPVVTVQAASCPKGATVKFLRDKFGKLEGMEVTNIY